VIVAIAGQIGVGKSTVARALAERLGVRYFSAGEAFREAAQRRGLTVLELNRLAEQQTDVDRDIDRAQADLARAGPCVVESRLAGWMVDADLKVWLRADFAVRAARVARREGVALEAAERDLRAREASEWQRYRTLYGIDTNDLSAYHLVVDTAYWSAADVVEAVALLAARMLRPERPLRGGAPQQRK
jgi:cytidylate kinase